MAEDRNFLSRWSQRKLQKANEEEEAPAGADAQAEGEATPDPAPGVDDAVAGDVSERHPTEDIDIESLTKESDFTVFMQKGVPQEVKRRALRKLWTSDPVLANLDGLNDYEDMERVYGMGPIGATAWKVGRGFLTDEELGLDTEKADKEAPAEPEEVVTSEAEAAEGKSAVADSDHPSGEDAGDGDEAEAGRDAESAAPDHAHASSRQDDRERG